MVYVVMFFVLVLHAPQNFDGLVRVRRQDWNRLETERET